MNQMAAEIETLKYYSLEELEEFLEKMSKELPPVDPSSMVNIEVDGEMYKIPEAVNNLLNSLYRMYERASTKNKLLE
jgi:division protein CdvB (Snf7/Vps24/ESCRT-III family)|tara:strand:- start:188 stop:418 length:231 start_codon:yes stop_codon:yes gene_type:complete